VSAPELAAAALFAVLGIRSIVHWLRQPMELDGRRDLVLFALFVVSRAGLWFGLMGLFLLFASVGTQGRAFTDDAAEFDWYAVILFVLVALHFVVTYFLRQRPPSPPSEEGSG
jgi:hypothetical protein